jgi:hypothetical protein
MSSYASRVRRHLATYKRRVLGVEADGVWSRNGRAYPHILPAQVRHLNLLELVRDDVLALVERTGIRLHADFHHLNSSQALAFNLFFPVLSASAGASSVVHSLTGLYAEPVSWTFEAVPDPSEGTNFDLLLSLAGGGTVYVEVKYTESSFGTALPDERHVRKLFEVYRPRLEGTVSPRFLEPALFFAHYQLLRNVCYLRSAADRVTFVVPAGNGTAIAHARAVLETALLPGVTGVSLVSLETVVAAARATASESVARHYDQFAEKYLPVTANTSDFDT